jgi:hypothetical protein
MLQACSFRSTRRLSFSERVLLKFDVDNVLVEKWIGPPGLRTWIRRGSKRLVKSLKSNLQSKPKTIGNEYCR